MGISSNTYNILASLFKHIFDENEFAPRGYTLIKGAYLQWRRGRGAMAPPIVETRRKIVNVVGNCRKLSENCQCCRKLSKLSTGVGGVSEDLECCPENFLVCRKKFSVCRKSTALAPPPPKKNPKKTWVPRRHCLLNNTVILRSRACTFTVGWSHCHIQNSL